MIDYLAKKKIIIVCGHYGAGKTNISLNLCVMLKEQTDTLYTLADLDTVNPYFRSADNVAELQRLGIDFIVPQFAGTNVDIPALPAKIYSIFLPDIRAVLDVGGDDNGATVLGMFADKIELENYEMIYVANKYRNLTAEAADATALAGLIEESSKLKITSVINNSNVGALTTKKEIEAALEYGKDIAKLLCVPLLATSFMGELDFFENKCYNMLKIKNYTKQLF
ncbi:MAG: cobalamin biosynthesis protein CobQ [Oscillospiraceae bacterium]|nr:cobalamin biosynthesis protein CobQ [Oscillospiraceae bacterium]